LTSFGKNIEQRLEMLRPNRLDGGYAGEAAVLMGIIERDGRPYFLLTRRTDRVATHKGQISFPGGMKEAADASPSDTAIRETQEELGVNARAVRILGEFHEYRAITNHKVRCFPAFISAEAEFELHSGEVAYTLEVPFEFFATTKPRVERQFRLGSWHDVYFYDFDGEDIWGLTARIIKDFVDFLD
jgi:8-oxo-dGTP pyrophosphatase MutT (NUDIX family)